MSFLSDINISKKLSRIILIISGTALLIASTAFISLEIISYRKTLVDRISVLSEFISINSASALSSNNANKAQLILQSLKAEESIDYAVIYKPQGDEFASYKIKPSIVQLHKGHDRHWMHKKLPTEFQFLFVANGLHVFKPILLNNEAIGYLSIFSNLKTLYEQIFNILSFTGLILLLTRLTVHYLSKSLQRRVSVPIQNLVDGMQQVSDKKDFSFRLSPGEQDEIGFLIERFNSMLGQIEDRDTELENYRDELEQEIKERTASLAKVKESEQRVRQLAYSDELTGLPSRTSLHTYLQDVIKTSHRQNERFALLFLDLDGFKYVNDSLGHDVGDLLLKKIAQRLQGLLREVDFIARLSGDEFCIIIDKICDQYDAAYVANRCLEEMNEAIQLGAQEIRPRCSIGIAYYPDDFATGHPEVTLVRSLVTT
jgi:diguanylate cyclase (GGDEF)-like protein